MPCNIDWNDGVYFLHHILPEDMLEIILKGTTGSRNQKVNYSKSIDNIEESTITVCHISFEAVQKVMSINLAHLISRQLARHCLLVNVVLVIHIAFLTT